MKQLEDLTRLAQGMKTASHPDHYPTVGTSASCTPPGYQPDIDGREIAGNLTSLDLA